MNKKRFQVQTTQSNHLFPIAKNLLRERKAPNRPNEVWVSDITFIRTEGGWGYLAGVLDLYSRKIVGWCISESINTKLVTKAMEKALRNRSAPEIHHSDRGCQYASHEYQNMLRSKGITSSMSRKGNCYDNAFMESFFGTLKTEEIKKKIFTGSQSAREAMFEYIRAYPVCRQISLKKCTIQE